MSQLIQEVWVKPLELARAFLTFCSEGGLQGVPGAAGSFQELPGPISGSEKIESGLNRHLRQQFAAISGWIFSPGFPGASGHAPRPFLSKKNNKNHNFGPRAPLGPSEDYAGEVRLNQMICLLYTSPSPRDLSTSRMPSSA